VSNKWCDAEWVSDVVWCDDVWVSGVCTSCDDAWVSDVWCGVRWGDAEWLSDWVTEWVRECVIDYMMSGVMLSK
jgi:hypothetical protein